MEWNLQTGTGVDRQSERAPVSPYRLPLRLCVLAAVLLGARLFLSRVFDVSLIQVELLATAAVLACIPWTSKGLAAALDTVRKPSPKSSLVIALLIWAFGSGYLAYTAHAQHRPLQPQVHDEQAYLIQTRLLAHGRLWQPQHPMADFFESFFVLARPVYAPIYFPGTALLYCPLALFGLESWFPPVCAAGLCLSLLYLVTTATIDGAMGLLASLLLLAVREFRIVSVMFLSQLPLLLFGLACLGLWLAWRRHRRPGWIFLISLAMGWAAVTRPVDALAFALPVGFGIARELSGNCCPVRVGLRALLLFLLGITPFLAMQLVFDYKTTGQFLLTPYGLYLHRDQPGSEYGFGRLNPAAQPQSKLPQKQRYFDQRMPELASHRLERLPAIAVERLKWAVDDSLPNGLLLILLTAAPFGIKDIRQLLVALVAPLFVLLYLPNPFYLPHYSVPLAAIVAFGICLGLRSTLLIARSTRGRRSIEVFAMLAVGALAVTSLPEIRGTRGGTGDVMFYPPLAGLAQIRADLQSLPTPAVVFFRYHQGDNVQGEPVYNSDVAWPDEARVVRAHDLGAQRDMLLVNYYSRRLPKRTFYLYDAQDSHPLHQLGAGDDPAHVLSELLRLQAAKSDPAG